MRWPGVRRASDWIWIGLLAGLSLEAAWPLPAEAHRLKGLLQATLVSLEPDRVRLEMELTPGIDIAPGLIGKLDRKQSGRISKAEGNAHALGVVGKLALSIDDTQLNPALVETWFPLTEAMTGGLGSIRIVVEAKLTKLAPGAHEIRLQNDYEPGISDYLVNALVPVSARIKITGQKRDSRQREYRLSFTLAP
jgi:hypothetical protein